MQGRRKGAAYVDLPEGWNIVGTGDFNGDGITDILKSPVPRTCQSVPVVMFTL